jgi:hypothetical protein
VRTWNLTFLQFVRWDMSYNLNLFSSAVHSAQFKVMVHVPPNKLYLIVNLLSLFFPFVCLAVLPPFQLTV